MPLRWVQSGVLSLARVAAAALLALALRQWCSPLDQGRPPAPRDPADDAPATSGFPPEPPPEPPEEADAEAARQLLRM